MKASIIRNQGIDNVNLTLKKIKPEDTYKYNPQALNL